MFGTDCQQQMDYYWCASRWDTVAGQIKPLFADLCASFSSVEGHNKVVGIPQY